MTVTTELLPAGTRPAQRPSPPAGGRAALAWAVGLGVLAADAVAVAWGRGFGPDTFISLTAGRWIAAHGLPHTDALSVAAHGRPWIDQQWLAHIAFYGLWRAGGNAAVAASSATAIGLAVAMLFALCVLRGAALMPAWIAAGGAFVICLMYAETRAQSFAYPLFVALLWILLAELDRGRFDVRALRVVPILVVWANLHGSVLVGAALAASCFGVRAAASACRRRWLQAGGDLAVTVLAGAAVLVSPYGTAVVGYYPRVLTDPALATVAEWQPSSFGLLNLPFVALLLGTIGVACFARGRGIRLPLGQVLLYAALAALATHAIRYQIWFAMGAAPLLATLLTSVRDRGQGTYALPARVAGIASALVATATFAAGGLLATASAAQWDGFVSASAVRTAEAIAARQPDDHVLADDSTGSALLWLDPSLAGRVGFDARTEIYPPSRFLRFDRFLLLSGGSWTAATQGYQVLAVTCWLHPGLCPAIRRLPDWRVIADRSGGLVAVRRA